MHHNNQLHLTVLPNCYAYFLIQVTKDNPRSICDCRFLGADNVALPLRAKFNQNLHRWDANALLRKNLECVLELQLPTAKSAALDPDQQILECAICYSFKLPREEQKEQGQQGGMTATLTHSLTHPFAQSLTHSLSQ